VYLRLCAMAGCSELGRALGHLDHQLARVLPLEEHHQRLGRILWTHREREREGQAHAPTSIGARMGTYTHSPRQSANGISSFICARQRTYLEALDHRIYTVKERERERQTQTHIVADG
jgi:hypothetical protein